MRAILSFCLLNTVLFSSSLSWADCAEGYKPWIHDPTVCINLKSVSKPVSFQCPYGIEGITLFIETLNENILENISPEFTGSGVSLIKKADRELVKCLDLIESQEDPISTYLEALKEDALSETSCQYAYIYDDGRACAYHAAGGSSGSFCASKPMENTGDFKGCSKPEGQSVPVYDGECYDQRGLHKDCRNLEVQWGLDLPGWFNQ